MVQMLRGEQRQVERIRVEAQLAKQKLHEQEEDNRNHQRKFQERTKALVDENRMLKEASEKMKKSFNDIEDNYKAQLEEARQEMESLRVRLTESETENKKLLMAINELQE